MCCWYLKKLSAMHILQPHGTATAITGSELNTEPPSVSVCLPMGWSLTIIWFLFPWLWNTCYLFMYTKVFPSLGVVGSKSKNGCASFMSWKEGLCHLLLELSRARRTQTKGTVKNNHIRNVNKGFFVLNHIGAFYTDRNMYPTQTTDDES